MADVNKLSLQGLKFVDIKERLKQNTLVDIVKFQKSSWVEKAVGVLGFLTFSETLFRPNASWIPGDPRIKLIFSSVLLLTPLALNIGRAIYTHSSLLNSLPKDKKEDFEVIPPRQLATLWPLQVVNKLLHDLNFDQLSAVWDLLTEDEKKWLDDAFIAKNGTTLTYYMNTLKGFQTRSKEEIIPVLTDQKFIASLKTLPGFFPAIIAAIKGRKDSASFNFLLFQIFFNRYDATSTFTQEDEKEVKVEVAYKGDGGALQERVEVTVPLGVVRRLKLTSFDRDYKGEKPLQVILGKKTKGDPEGRQIPTPNSLKEALRKFTLGEEPSLQWLLDNYQLLSTFNFAPYLYTLQKLLFYNTAELPRHTSLTGSEIAVLLYENRPKEVSKVLGSWAEAQVDETNLLIAMTYSVIYQLPELRNKCMTALKIVKDKDKYKEILEHATLLEDDAFKTACFQGYKPGFHNAWEHLFEMPGELIARIAEQTGFSIPPE